MQIAKLEVEGLEELIQDISKKQLGFLAVLIQMGMMCVSIL